MYKEILYNISTFEKKKSRNQERIKTIDKEHNKLYDDLKKLYKLKISLRNWIMAPPPFQINFKEYP